MQKKKIIMILTVFVLMFSVSCGQAKLGTTEEDINIEITKPQIEKMQIGEQTGMSSRENLVNEALGLEQQKYYDYKTDDSVKEMSVYLMEVDDNGKWVKKEIAKETILPKERTFLIATSIKNSKMYLGFSKDENELSGAYDIPLKRSDKVISSADFSGKENIEKGEIIPLFMYYSYDDKNSSKIDKAFENKEDPSGVKTMYENPDKVKQLLDNHFLVGVEFK